MRRLGLLGGTFDPIHMGHLDVARAAADALHLEEIRLTPLHIPSHRPAPGASPFHRFAMVSQAAATDGRFVASDDELTRGGESYTSDTLRALHLQGWTASQLFFLTGADAFAEIAMWKDYPALLNLAHFVVCSRPGREAGLVRGLLPELADRMTESHEFVEDGVTRILLLDAATADVSSSGIRGTLETGGSIDGMVPPAVAAHIQKHGLYNARQRGSVH